MKEIHLPEILALIAQERTRQDKIWGPNDPGFPHISEIASLIGYQRSLVAKLYEIPTAEKAKKNTESSFSAGTGSLAHILVEEVCESLEAAADSMNDASAEVHLEEELIQVAAVAVKWVQIIRSRRGD